MSKSTTAHHTDQNDEHWIAKRYDEIKREAESDMPDAWVFQRLVEYAEANGLVGGEDQ